MTLIYPIPNILPTRGTIPRILETNVKSIISSNRAMALINHDIELLLELLLELELEGKPEGVESGDG